MHNEPLSRVLFSEEPSNSREILVTGVLLPWVPNITFPLSLDFYFFYPRPKIPLKNQVIAEVCSDPHTCSPGSASEPRALGGTW